MHQTYDYQAPNFFLFLSILSVQRNIKPDKHILWVNDEGRFRRGHWESWQKKAQQMPGTWEQSFQTMLSNGTIEARLTTFPAHPPGNKSTFAPNKAHRSDFVRMSALFEMGGIYLDTDAFALHSLDSLRVHDFVLSFDNIVNPDQAAPKRLNNGVLLSAPKSPFLMLWMKAYARFNPNSFDFDSSVVPYRLATHFPDLVHIEWSRISPLSYGFQTYLIADSLTCAPYQLHPPAVWYPDYDHDAKSYTFEKQQPDEYMGRMLSNRLVLHLTMSHVRGLSMLRKQLQSPEDLNVMPSFLGHVFRLIYYGYDDFDYQAVWKASADDKLKAYRQCRDRLGMHTPPDKLTQDERTHPHMRQQYQVRDVESMSV